MRKIRKFRDAAIDIAIATAAIAACVFLMALAAAMCMTVYGEILR